MKPSIALCSSLALLFTAASASALSLSIKNESDWEIHELYFQETSSDEWGPDQLGKDVIKKGDTFTLTKIDKGKYDMKIVDEDGDSCEVPNVDFTASESFTLDSKLLLGCQAATEEASEEDEE